MPGIANSYAARDRPPLVMRSSIGTNLEVLAPFVEGSGHGHQRDAPPSDNASRQAMEAVPTRANSAGPSTHPTRSQSSIMRWQQSWIPRPFYCCSYPFHLREPRHSSTNPYLCLHLIGAVLPWISL